MTRVGNNPLKGKRADKTPPIVACVITHLPDQMGYHSNRLQVIQTSLTSLRKNAGQDIPVMVWDNGSGPELRNWLYSVYKPEYLILSQNVGKTSARTAIPRMFPPTVIIAIADDDMLYYPGWLKPQVELLKAFPNVGQVSGYPVRTQARWGITSTVAWANNNGASLEVGRFIPDEWDKDFCTSIGRDYEWHSKKYAVDDQDYRITAKGKTFYAMAHHCQFVAYAGRIADITQWSEMAMDAEQGFDKTIDEARMLRLTTTERLTRHMGNVLDPELKSECRKMGVLYGK